MAHIARTYERDPRPYRATFGVSYPDELLRLDKPADLSTQLVPVEGHAKCEVEARRVLLKIRGKNVANVVFRRCLFHLNRGQGATPIRDLTFVSCCFEQCFLGFVRFERVHFEQCEFIRCDLSRSEFVDCIFTDCTFAECTASKCLFSGSEIDPNPLLAGLLFPDWNMKALENEQREKYKTRWRHDRWRLSGQLLRSNLSCANDDFVDRALLVHRREAYRHSLRRWRCCGDGTEGVPQSLGSALKSAPLGWGRGALGWLRVLTTSAGTSLRKQMVFLVAAIALVPVVLLLIDASYQGAPLYSAANEVGVSGLITAYFRAFPAAIGLILVFGHTHVTCSNDGCAWGTVAITVVGLVWYAVVVPVVLRRWIR